MRHATTSPVLASLTLLLCAAGCGGPALDATSVLSYDQCRGIGAGLTRVDYADVAGIRGGTLLNLSQPAPAPDAGPADSELVLVAISRGQQPTPGYAMTLQDARRHDATAVINVNWQTPPSGAVLAEMITHPCLVVGLVVGLPGSGLTSIEAVDQHGASLGSLAL